MEQGAQSLWTKGDAAPAVEPSAPPAKFDEDVQAYLSAVQSALEADQAFLTLRSDLDPEASVEIASVGRALSLKAHEQVATLASPKAPANNEWATPAADPEWSTCMLDQRSWHVLRLPVWSRRARTSVVLQLLFRTASLADRSRTLLKLQTLRPMVEPYLRLWQRMRVNTRGAAGLRGALDAVEMGVLLVDKSSRILFANASADRIMAAGEPLRRLGESFTATDVRQAVPLQVALSHAIAENVESGDRTDRDGSGGDGAGGEKSGGGTVKPRRASMLALKSQRLGRSLMLSVMPMRERATERLDGAAIVYIVDPKCDVSKQLLPVCALFGLSPVESRLVCLLTAGRTLQDAAKTMRIKDQTARSYLKQIFLKTGTGRQADLVRVMLCSLLRVEQEAEPLFIKSGG